MPIVCPSPVATFTLTNTPNKMTFEQSPAAEKFLNSYFDLNGVSHSTEYGMETRLEDFGKLYLRCFSIANGTKYRVSSNNGKDFQTIHFSEVYSMFFQI